MVCCKGKERKGYLDYKCTSEQYPSWKNKHVHIEGLSASVGFRGLQLFGLFSFTRKEFLLVLHLKDSIKLHSTLLKKIILNRHSDPNHFDAFVLRYLSFPMWQMSVSRVFTGRKKREKSEVEATLDQICQAVCRLYIFLSRCLGMK